MLDRTFWQGRQVLVTGHTGFKGSWLSLWLEALGAAVTGYALDPPTHPNLYEHASVAKHIHSICADIRDFQRLKSAVAECRPEVVIHLAAQSVVRRGYQDPIETYSSNVMGTVHLLEAVRQQDRPCVLIIVTSDKCYDNREWVWGYREDDPLGGHDPYSSSKACAELVTAAYRASFFPLDTFDGHRIVVASARAGNVIGGGDWAHHQLIPDLVRAFLAGQECLIRNPSAVRPWQFVLEPLRGYLMLAERLGAQGSCLAGAWNFGPAAEDAKPVSWIANELTRRLGGTASWRPDAVPQFSEAHILKLDTSKATSQLGWRPILPLNMALEWVVEWYRAFQEGADLAHLTRDQVERYEALTVSHADSENNAAKN